MYMVFCGDDSENGPHSTKRPSCDITRVYKLSATLIAEDTIFAATSGKVKPAKHCSSVPNHRSSDWRFAPLRILNHFRRVVADPRRNGKG